MATIIFTYGELFETTPLYQGQRPSGPYPPLGYSAHMYTTGRLEYAGTAGHDCVVVCSKNALQPHDDWWRVFVPKERIFLAPTPEEIEDAEITNSMSAIEIYPWRMLAIYLKWPYKDIVAAVNLAEIQSLIFSQSNVFRGGMLAPRSNAHHP